MLIDTPGIVSKKYAKKMGMPREFTAGPVRSVMEADMGEGGREGGRQGGGGRKGGGERERGGGKRRGGASQHIVMCERCIDLSLFSDGDSGCSQQVHQRPTGSGCVEDPALLPTPPFHLGAE